MPRNKSEKIPHPELPRAIHKYYKVRVMSPVPTSRSELLWHGLSRESQDWVRNHWNSTPEHDALKAYYLRVSKSDGAK